VEGAVAGKSYNARTKSWAAVDGDEGKTGDLLIPGKEVPDAGEPGIGDIFLEL
jgi:hypothetical protein